MPTTVPAVRRCSFDDLPGFSELFARYCSDYDAVAEYYAGDFRSVEARRSAAQRAADHPRDRDRIADVLLDQNEQWGLTEATRANIEALRDPASAAVVTGQQVGLLTGPLYTICKTITTLQLADQLAEETGRPVVPVFWVEGEDHDFDEIAHTQLLHRNDLVQLRYEGHRDPDDGNLGAVGRLELSDQISEVLDRLDAILPPSDFKPDVMERVRSAYQPGTPIEDAFTQLMRSLFPDAGLVFLNPDDARLKALVEPLFRREIEDHATPHERIEAVSEQLREDYHAQVHARPTNLFWLDEDGRTQIDAQEDGTFVLRGRERTFSRGELLDHLDETPERFSPNVVLRPLMQDALVPTAAYVAGPGETAYFAQYKGVYEWAEIPMPIIYPRASVSLVESKVEKVLEKYDLGLCDLGGDFEQLFQQVVVETMDVDVDAVFKNATRHVHEAINTLKPSVEKVDRTLVRSAEATRAVLQKEMNELKQRVVRAEKRNQEEVRDQLRKAHDNLFPTGTPQERVVSVLYFLNKYSPDLLAELRQTLSVDTTAHQVVSI